jgi:hypothetical protein
VERMGKERRAGMRKFSWGLLMWTLQSLGEGAEKERKMSFWSERVGLEHLGRHRAGHCYSGGTLTEYILATAHLAGLPDAPCSANAVAGQRQ